MSDRMDAQLKTLLEEAAAGVALAPTDDKGKVGAFYASFMDETALETLGVRAIAPELGAIRSARDNGALVELLRTYPGSRVNHHVARFVAWGRRADHLFATQPWDYALGHDSALDRLVELDGKILLLGCDHDTVTFLHYAEHVSDLPGRTVTRYLVPVLERGGRVWRAMEEIDTNAAHPNWPERFFARIVDLHLRRTDNPGGPVGDARSHLMSARALLDRALPIMRQIALDHRVADEVLGTPHRRSSEA
jgi:aminoglycoside 3-N-acetyltransferase